MAAKSAVSYISKAMFGWRNLARNLYNAARRAGNPSSVRNVRDLRTAGVLYCQDEKDPKEEEISKSMSSKYEVFVDYKSPIIFDVEQEREKFYEVNDESEQAQKKFKDFEGIAPTRGETGVFDIQELVAILKKEKVIDMTVIKIPEKFAYVDYFVIITGRSRKHMIAVAEYIRRVWKYKTDSKGHIPTVEGETSKDWKALDLGNIVLHIMSNSAREMYDLESLWSVGPKYDIKSHLEGNANDYSYESILSKLMPASEIS